MSGETLLTTAVGGQGGRRAAGRGDLTLLPSTRVFDMAPVSSSHPPHFISTHLPSLTKAAALLPRSQGAQDSMMPSLADLRIDSGSGME